MLRVCKGKLIVLRFLLRDDGKASSYESNRTTVRMFALILDYSRARALSPRKGIALPSSVVARVFAKSRFARLSIADTIAATTILLACHGFSHNLEERRKSPVMKSTGD